MKIKLWASFVGAAFLLLACDLNLNGAAPPSPQESEELLRQRVNSKWKALIDEDYRKVYDFTSPLYRKSHDYTEFRANYGGQIKRKAAEVYKIEFLEPDSTTARVRMKLDIEAFVMSLGTPLNTVSYVDETWSYVSGEWWYLEKN